MEWLLIIPLFIGLVLFGFRVWYKTSGIGPSQKYSSTLVFHNVSDRFDLSVSNLRRGKFIRLIDWAENSGYHFDTLDKLIAGDSNDDFALRISFDDGYENFYRLYRDYIEPRKIPCVLFVTTGYLGKRATWDYKPCPVRHLSLQQLKELSASPFLTIGSHSKSHADLTAVEYSQMADEIAGSRKFLEDFLEREVIYFSYPFGRFNKRVIEQVKKAGYRAAFCGVPPKFEPGNNLFQIPRIPLNLFDNLFTFRQKIRPGLFSWIEFSKARVIELYSGLTFRVRGER